MGKHVRALGWFHIILGMIDLLMGLAAFGLMSGLGLLSGEATSFGIMSLIGGLAGGFMLLMALPNFICGLGLLRNGRGWVIILAVVLGVFNLLKFPFGTAIALYTFWVAWRIYEVADE